MSKKNIKLFSTPISFGPNELIGVRKEERIFSPLCPLHLILKSRKLIFKSSDQECLDLIRKYAGRFNVQLFSMAQNNDHLHLLAKFPSRKAYNRFVRTLTAALARRHKEKGLFPERPFTRLVHWGRDFENLKKYLDLYKVESMGLSRTEALEYFKP